MLGKLFTSKTYNKTNSELNVIVTPELVEPIPDGQPVPDLERPDSFIKGPGILTEPPRTPGVDKTGPGPVRAPRTEISVQEMQQLQKAGQQVQTQGTAPPSLLGPALIMSPAVTQPLPSSNPGSSPRVLRPEPLPEPLNEARSHSMNMMPLTAAFVISNRTVWEQAHACVQNLPVRLAVEQGIGQGDSTETDALLDRIERHRVDVVLVEASRIALPLEEFVRRIRSTAAQPAVFVLNTDASPAFILEALRAGANEYLYPPLTDTLRDALQRLSTARSRGGSDTFNALGKVFGFLSARGGCGATTIAVHAATELARQAARKRGPERRAVERQSPDKPGGRQPMLLADFDFEAGLLRFLIKSKNTYSVRDAIDNLRRMDSSLWKALVSSHADELDVIPAPDEVAAKRSPEREEMTHLMRFVRSTYSVSIADYGRSISMAALDSLPELEVLYLVTTPDFTSIERARRAIGDVEERGFAGDRLKVLLNRAGERGKTRSR